MRRRKHNRELPRRVYIRHSAYYFVAPDGKWHRLCATGEGMPRMLVEYSLRLSGSPISRQGDMPQRIAEFLKEHLPKLRSGSARKEYRRMFEVAEESFRDFSVAQVTTRDVKTFLKQWAATPTAQRAYKARLSTFFSWCVNEELRTENPCREIKLKKILPRDRYITHLEFFYASMALVRAKGGLGSRSGRVMRAIFDLAYLTGQRCTDVRALLWANVTAEGIYFKPSKTSDSSGAKVLVPRTPEIEEVLTRFAGLRVNRSAHVVHQRDGSEYTASALRSAWRRAKPHAEEAYRDYCRLAGLDPDPGFLSGATVKDLRAKALTDAERAGYSIEQLRIMAAHSSISTTEKYFKERRIAVNQVTLSLPRKPAVLDNASKTNLDDEPTLECK